ncbi:dTDP-4-amino-4,6-dideoxy-D-galactose acyltransferase, partial [Escherichia coli]|nr:dTDP-4-amino-4,6-dideoxy-D-galactose acyltransferase [Escherichia coli]
MSVRASIDCLQWESDFFGLPTAKLDFAAPHAETVLASQLDGYAITQAKILASDTERLDGLMQLGFSLVEGE